MDPMPTLLVLALIAVFCHSASAEIWRTSQMVGFSTGNLGAVGTGEGWSGSSSIYTVTNGSGSLIGTSLGLVASSGDKAYVSTNTGSLNTYNTFASSGQFSGPTNLYYSFLIRFPDAADTDGVGEQIISVNRLGSSSGIHFELLARNSGGMIQLGANKPSGTAAYATTNIASGQTAFVVVREQMIAGPDNDIIDLWINPATNLFGVDEGSIPAPSVSTSSGSEDTSGTGPGRFYLRGGTGYYFDELRITSTWADATPTPLNCDSAVIGSSPSSVTLTEGINAIFSVTASGTSPSYAWQFSTDSGANWSAVTNGSGSASPTYTSVNFTAADNGIKYRCIATASCNGSSATSAVATVTVNAAVVTPAGLIMNDTWADADRVTGPITTNNSIWYASTSSSLLFSGPSLFGVPASSSSRLWVGYFTPNTNLPVSLAVGGTIKATWAFKADNITTQTNGALRFGLFDYADGGARLTGDDFGSGSSGNGENVRGYMVDLDFAQTFGDNPMDIRARTVLTSANLLGSSGDYSQLGSGPAGLNGAPGLQNLTDYTLAMSVTRTAQNSVDVTTVLTGGGTNWSWTVTDNNYAYHRFDAVGIRPNSLETTADTILFQQFNVVVTQTVLPFGITSIQRLTSDSVKLTWDAVSGVSYQVQSRDLLGSGGWVTNATVAATSSSQSYTNSGVSAINARYYRVVAP